MYANITIEGVTPLLMNRFPEENEINISGSTSPVLAGDRETPREQAQKKAYRNKDTGELEFPCQNIMACIIEAGKFFTQGKSKLTTQKASLIPAGVAVEGLTVPFGLDDFEVDSRSVVIPSTRGRAMCHRPRLDKWKLTFSIFIDESLFDPKFVREIVDRAGKTVGLGDYRPSCKGSFGKFVVKHWEEVAHDKKKAA